MGVDALAAAALVFFTFLFPFAILGTSRLNVRLVTEY
jgi:hypothetical protein